MRRLEASRLVRRRGAVLELDVLERPAGLLCGNAVEVVVQRVAKRGRISRRVFFGVFFGVFQCLGVFVLARRNRRLRRNRRRDARRLEPFALRDARLHEIADAAPRARRGPEPRPGRFRGLGARRQGDAQRLPRLAQARRRRRDGFRAKLGLLAQALERGGVQDVDRGARVVRRVFNRARGVHVSSRDCVKVGRLHPRVAEALGQVGVRPVAAQLRLRARQQFRGVAVLDAGETQPERVVRALASQEHLDRLEVRARKLDRLVERLRGARAHAHRHGDFFAPLDAPARRLDHRDGGPGESFEVHLEVETDFAFVFDHHARVHRAVELRPPDVQDARAELEREFARLSRHGDVVRRTAVHLAHGERAHLGARLGEVRQLDNLGLAGMEHAADRTHVENLLGRVIRR